MDGIGQRIINEILHTVGTIYRILIGSTIILGLLFIPIYYFHVSILCQNTLLIPFIHRYCPGREINILSYLPLDNLTDNSVSLAETLSNADVSVPMRCVQARLAFIEIRAEIIHGDMNPEIKNNLAEIILDLQKLMDKGAQQSTIMMTSYSSALDAIKIHTEFLLDDLSKSKNSNNYQSQQLQTESSNTKTTDLAINVVDEYTIVINNQIDNALFKTQEVDVILNLIIGKIEIIQELAKRGKRIDNSELDQLLKNSIWNWVFGKDVVNVRKHQRNIKTLNELNDFIRKLSRETADIIVKLLKFKHNAINVKETAAELLTLQHKDPARQLAIIKASINRLEQVKQDFEKKMNEENGLKYIT